MPSIETTSGAMNLSELQPRSLAPSLEGIGAAQALAGRSPSARLRATDGNQLLGLDVWAGTSAADRVLGRAGAVAPGGAAHLDQLVSHILAPLG